MVVVWWWWWCGVVFFTDNNTTPTKLFLFVLCCWLSCGNLHFCILDIKPIWLKLNNKLCNSLLSNLKLSLAVAKCQNKGANAGAINHLSIYNSTLRVFYMDAQTLSACARELQIKNTCTRPSWISQFALMIFIGASKIFSYTDNLNCIEDNI